MDIGNPDFVRYAESHGAHGHRPASVVQRVEMLAATGRAPGVHLIDLAIDCSDNPAILSDEIRSLSALV